MATFNARPVFERLTAIVLLVSIAGACIALYIFFEHLNQGLKDKKVLDQEWLKLDREDHQGIKDICKAAQAEVKLLAAKLEGDSSLIYELGLRDGMALCKAGHGNR